MVACVSWLPMVRVYGMLACSSGTMAALAILYWAWSGVSQLTTSPDVGDPAQVQRGLVGDQPLGPVDEPGVAGPQHFLLGVRHDGEAELSVVGFVSLEAADRGGRAGVGLGVGAPCVGLIRRCRSRLGP